MDYYRAVPRHDVQAGEKIRRFPGRRLPGNIPYLVDNLWEFARPDAMPSRRHAVYASPSPELALKCASAYKVPQDQLLACRVEFGVEPVIFQLSVPDAREHEDVGNLQKYVNKLLGKWSERDAAGKQELATLFLPGITKQELAAAMVASTLLAEVVEAAAATVSLWQTKPIADGEMFFEISDENYYVLHPL